MTLLIVSLIAARIPFPHDATWAFHALVVLNWGGFIVGAFMTCFGVARIMTFDRE